MSRSTGIREAKQVPASTIVAMACAAAVTAQFVGSRAARDAFFLSALDFTALPAMLIATSACSVLLVVAHSRWASRVAPGVLVPASFVLSGVLFLAEWFTRSKAPAATAVFLYLHVSGAGPLLASGFWLIATERFDPRTAKKRFGQIAAAGTFGGLLGGLLAERVAASFGASAVIIVLAAFQFLTAWLVRVLASRTVQKASPVLTAETAARGSLRVVAAAPHLRHPVTLVLLGTTGAALLEYLFKARAVDALGPGDHLLRFFALYYGVTNLVTFALQAWSSRAVLERFGLALTTTTPSIALLAGSVGALFVPGFGSIVVARGMESIFRGSWFRAGYELFYTPIPAAEKRAAKSVVDVGVDRLGDAVGGGLVRAALMLTPALQSPAILVLAMSSAIGAIFAASRLNHWYVRTLEDSLVAQAGGAEPPRTREDSTEKVLLRVQQPPATVLGTSSPTSAVTIQASAADAEVQDILALRSRDRARIVAILSREEGLAPALVPHVIPLLAWPPAADHVFFALRKVAEERIGELTDALLDPNQDYAVRLRLARVFSVGVSQRAADGLLRALGDARFDVRVQAARSLAAILEKNPLVQIDRAVVHAAVLREVAVSRPVWESRRLLEGLVSESPLDEAVRDRADQSLAHVFAVLSLVLPPEPLQIAFRGLNSRDKRLRGTALEYLEGVLPSDIKQRLWPFIVPAASDRRVPDRGEVMASLLRSKAAMTMSGTGRSLDSQIAGFGAA